MAPSYSSQRLVCGLQMPDYVYKLLVKSWKAAHDGAEPDERALDSIWNQVTDVFAEGEPELAEEIGHGRVLLVRDGKAHLLRLEPSRSDGEEVVMLEISYLGALLGGAYKERITSDELHLWFKHDSLGLNPLELTGTATSLEGAREVLRAWAETTPGPHEHGI